MMNLEGGGGEEITLREREKYKVSKYLGVFIVTSQYFLCVLLDV